LHVTKDSAPHRLDGANDAACTYCLTSRPLGEADSTGADVAERDEVEAETRTARTEAVAALLRMRDAGGQVFSVISEAQPLAPHHLLALRAVADGACNLSDVAAHTDRHVSSVSRVIDQLVTDGLLSRSQHPDDRRQIVLATTPRGQQLVDRFEALDRSLANRMLAAFDRDESRVLAEHLDRLAAAAMALATELENDPALLETEQA
jgi:DNA-binding MarR family transcriptional regulator